MNIKTALSVRQPWAWLLVNGYKDVENRNWQTNFRGKCIIHASKTFDHLGYRWVKNNFGKKIKDFPAQDQFDRGGIIGWVEISDCVTEYDSPWFFGKFGFVVEDSGTLPFEELPGQLRFFEVVEKVDNTVPVHKIKVRVNVKPSSLVAKTSQIARITVRVENPDGDPVEGVALRGEIIPDILGNVSPLQKTDSDGHSYGKWIAGDIVGTGLLRISKVDSDKEETKARVRLKPIITVDVNPSELFAGSGAVATVEVTVLDYLGNPIQGIKLFGSIDPPALGSVIGFPASDIHGCSTGYWTAGWAVGRGYLNVSGGGAQGEAEIKVLKPKDDNDGGDGDGDDDGNDDDGDDDDDDDDDGDDDGGGDDDDDDDDDGDDGDEEEDDDDDEDDENDEDDDDGDEDDDGDDNGQDSDTGDSGGKSGQINYGELIKWIENTKKKKKPAKSFGSGG
jgi:hypothetical protein